MTVDVYETSTGLWRTDGTVAGTFQIATFASGLDVASEFTPLPTLRGSFNPFITSGGDAYFTLNTGQAGQPGELWRTDGTAQGTVDLGVVATGQTSSAAALNGDLFFMGGAGAQTGLWETNGTQAGTHLVTAMASASADVVTVGDQVFVGAPGLTPGTMTTADGDVVFVNGTDLFDFNGKVAYVAPDPSNGGAQLWVSDGTAGGTVEVTQLNGAAGYTPDDFTVVDGRLVFRDSSDGQQTEMWSTDGTAAGTVQLTAAGVAPAPDDTLVVYGGEGYFGSAGGYIWRTDGTAAGTQQVWEGTVFFVTAADIGDIGGNLIINGVHSGLSNLVAVSPSGELTIYKSEFPAPIPPLLEVGGLVYLPFQNNGQTDTLGLWVTDGAMPGTQEIMGGNGVPVTALGAQALFTDDGSLYITNGTTAGTQLLGAISQNDGFTPFTGLTPLTPLETVPRDLSGDGFSDILFSQTGGTLAVWEMNGTSIIGGGSIGAPGGTWAEVGSGDFNGDGYGDILFQDGSHNLAIWEMNGASITGGGAIGNPGGTWSAAGVGDFNGDGEADILFQDASGNLAIWEMNGTTIIGGGAIGNPGGTWAEKAIGDFNGDGKSDILFVDASGNLAVWEMNGTSIIGGGAIGNPGPGWTVEGTGDFNGDGMSDILFENSSTGDYAIWEMNGTSIIGGGDIGNPGGTWQFAGIGDFNGDGHADILFTDAAGDLAIWEMNGTSIVGGGEIGNPGSVWHVLG